MNIWNSEFSNVIERGFLESESIENTWQSTQNCGEIGDIDPRSKLQWARKLIRDWVKRDVVACN